MVQHKDCGLVRIGNTFQASGETARRTVTPALPHMEHFVSSLPNTENGILHFVLMMVLMILGATLLHQNGVSVMELVQVFGFVFFFFTNYILVGCHTVKDAPCVFPFKYNGSQYSQCIGEGSLRQGETWCAVSVGEESMSAPLLKNEKGRVWDYCFRANCSHKTVAQWKAERDQERR